MLPNFFFTDQHFLLVVPLNPKMNRGSTGSGLTTAKQGKNQQAGNFQRLSKILGLLRGLVISGLQEITHTIISDLG